MSDIKSTLAELDRVIARVEEAGASAIMVDADLLREARAALAELDRVVMPGDLVAIEAAELNKLRSERGSYLASHRREHARRVASDALVDKLRKQVDALREERREARFVVANVWVTLGVLARWPRKARWQMGTRREYARYFAGRLLEQLNGWGMPPAHLPDADGPKGGKANG